MKNALVMKPLMIKKSAIHGYGVFAKDDIQVNEIIEECHALLTSGEDAAFTDYSFASNNEDYHLVPFGFGCIYNHADNNNATYYYDEEKKIMVFYAKRFIPKGEEVFVNYGEEWFIGRNLPIKKISSFKKLLRFGHPIPVRSALVITLLIGLIYSLQFLLTMAQQKI